MIYIIRTLQQGFLQVTKLPWTCVAPEETVAPPPVQWEIWHFGLWWTHLFPGSEGTVQSCSSPVLNSEPTAQTNQPTGQPARLCETWRQLAGCHLCSSLLVELPCVRCLNEHNRSAPIHFSAGAVPQLPVLFVTDNVCLDLFQNDDRCCHSFSVTPQKQQRNDVDYTRRSCRL